MAQPTNPQQSAQTSGFGHSRRRIAIELVLLGVGIVTLCLLALRLAVALAGTLIGYIPTSVDESLGEPAWTAMTQIRCAGDAQEYIEELAVPLLQAMGEQPFEFRFAVIPEDSPNAFALPGGFVTVHYGLIEFAESGEEIAAVLAHEMYHATLRHGFQRILREAGGSAILGLIFGWSDVASIVHLAGDLVDLSYDRAQESEADERGTELLMKAGIDPGGLGRFFARLKDKQAEHPISLLSTHPAHADRIAASEQASAGFAPTVTLRSPVGITCN